jgi:hypothetical protein
MTTLDKQLARSAQECQRIHADHWSLALTNGCALKVSARRDEGFLLLDADTAVSPAADRLVPLVEGSRELPAAVKFALRGPTLRLRAEFPLPEDSDVAEERIHEHLEGMRSASHWLHNWVSCGAAGEEVACPQPGGDGQATPGNLKELLHEAGWPYHERPGGALLADLETGSQFLQAEIEPRGAGTRFRVTLYRHEAPGDDDARQALSLYLLEANAALRYARAFLRKDGGEVAAGFEVGVGNGPSAAEAGHALAALSVAGRQCAREMEVLKDGALAGIYGSARPLWNHQIK